MATVESRISRESPPLRLPTEDEIKQAREASLRFDPRQGQAGGDRPSVIRMIIRDRDGAESELEVPPLALSLLGEILDELARGNAVILEPVPRLLSIAQAAELLDVSWKMVRDLIDKGELACETDEVEGQRVVFDGLMAYRKNDDEATSKALDEMVALSQELGLGY